MTKTKAAPPKKSANRNTRSGNNRNQSSRNNQGQQQTPDQQGLADDIKELFSTINRSGHSIESVIQMLKEGQTRQGPGLGQDPKGQNKSTPVTGIIAKDFQSIEQSLRTQENRISEIKAKLQNIGYFDNEPLKDDGKDKTSNLSDVVTFTAKTNIVDSILVRHNALLLNIIEHFNHLFADSHN